MGVGGKSEGGRVYNLTAFFLSFFSPEIWKDAESFTVLPDNSQVVELSPYGNYSFRVIAWNSVGSSDPYDGVMDYTVCNTPPDLPESHPRNVMAQGDEPDNLIIYWDVRIYNLFVFGVNSFNSIIIHVFVCS